MNLKVNGPSLRRLAYAGARYGPRPFVAHAPVVLGTLFAVLLPEHRRHVARNLERIRGRKMKVADHAEAVGTFIEFAHCLTEGLASDRPEAEHVTIQVTGRRYLEDALARGAGVIVVTAHTGAWDIAARLLRQSFEAEVMLAMAAEPSEAARRFHDSLRSRTGVSVVHVGGHALDVLPIARHLKKGGVLAVQLDRVGSGPAIDVNLFGGPERVPAGPFAIARVTGAPVVPVFCRRTGHFAYAIEACPMIQLDRAAGDADVVAAASQAARCMEDFIARHPTQWFDFPR